MKWLGGNQALSFRIRSNLRVIRSNKLILQLGKWAQKSPMSQSVLETDMECSPEIVTFPMVLNFVFLFCFFLLCLALVMPFKTLMCLPLVNTFSAYVEKLKRVWRRAKTTCQRTSVLFFNLERRNVKHGEETLNNCRAPTMWQVCYIFKKLTPK